MALAALILSAVALLLVVLVALAILELLVQRPAGDQEPPDAIEEFDLASGAEGALASSLGLPRALDDLPSRLVLVVSPMCAACHRLVASFEGVVPEHVLVLVSAANPARLRQWSAAAGLPHDEIVFDDDMAVVNSLGVTSSPAAVGFVRGRAAFGVNVSGRGALDALVSQRLDIDVAPPSGEE
ncbi:hypothetical protein [Candidatus Poriferisodalis sp.]|uniref:hypothetical protein n=1 Tax=Candidatus Poriferisodalis sp. TaxID=3101277 RepID=UPI003B020F66